MFEKKIGNDVRSNAIESLKQKFVFLLNESNQYIHFVDRVEKIPYAKHFDNNSEETSKKLIDILEHPLSLELRILQNLKDFMNQFNSNYNDKIFDSDFFRKDTTFKEFSGFLYHFFQTRYRFYSLLEKLSKFSSFQEIAKSIAITASKQEEIINSLSWEFLRKFHVKNSIRNKLSISSTSKILNNLKKEKVKVGNMSKDVVNQHLNNYKKYSEKTSYLKQVLKKDKLLSKETSTYVNEVLAETYEEMSTSSEYSLHTHDSFLINSVKAWTNAGNFQKAMEVCLKINDYHTVAILLENLGRTTGYIQAYKKAAEYYEKIGILNQAVEISKKIGDSWNEQRLSGELARRSERHAEHAKTEKERKEYYSYAAMYWESAGDLESAAENYEKSGDFENAGRLYKKAHNAEKEIEAYEKGRSNSSKFLKRLYFKRKASKLRHRLIK